MALQVWLPLNGDLHNQGLKNIQITTTGTTVVPNGKIGSCYQFGTAASDITIAKEAMTFFTTEASVCFWIKILNWNSNYATFFQAGSASTAWAAYTFGLLRNNANSNCCFTISNGSSASNASYLTPTFELDKWYHISLIYKTGHCLIYINGEIYRDYTTSIIPNFSGITTIKIGRCTNGSSYQTNCLINDFRIYDHALSAKEVEEISKGLVLHYKLDDPYAESSSFLTSEITNTAYNSPISKYGYNETSNLGKVNGYFQGKYCTKVYTLADNQTSQPYAYFSNLFTSDGTNSPVYKTLSFDYYTTVPTTTWLNIYKLGNGSGTATWKTTNSQGIKSGVYTNSSSSILVQPGEWNHVEVTFQGTTAEDAQWGYCINGPRYTSNSNYYFLYANIQLELNNHATGYGERMHSNIIYDSSGYQNNGKIFTPLTLSSETTRYICSIYFNGETSAIKVPYTDIASTDDIFTLNLWFKKDDLGSKNYETLFGGPSGFEMDTRAGSATALTLYMASTRGTIFTQFNFGEWYMITMVNNGTNELYYVNAELKKTIDKKPMPAGNYYIGAWSTETRQNYKGLISDFRIYKTALTEKQIKELYDTSATVDKKGNMYGRELIE